MAEVGAFWWHLILLTEAALLAAGGIGYAAVRRHRADAHHWMMLLATAVVFGWIGSYMVMALTYGYVRFGGPPVVYHFLFIPLILVHSLVSTLALFLCAVSVALGFKFSGRRGGRRVLLGEEGRRHRRVGKLTLWFFVGSAATAYLAYAFLYIFYKPPAA
ncbi:MAG: DUF420 domain-containing protein [Thermaerobacter sp.]|nr:DUF420 domain-containing protein [Thermaerobacter sp.]